MIYVIRCQRPILAQTVTLVSLRSFFHPEKQTNQYQNKRKYNMKKKPSQLYQLVMEDPFKFHVFHWETFFLHKSWRQTARIKVISQFYKYRPRYMYILLSKYIPRSQLTIFLNTSILAVAQSVINKTRERTRRVRAVTGLFI